MIKVLFALLLGVLLGVAGSYTLGHRYTVTPFTSSSAYQVDNITGRAWLLAGNHQIPLERAEPGEWKIE